VRGLKLVNQLNLILQPGREPQAFDVGRLRMTPSICFESVLAHVVRGQVAALTAAGREPQVLVNLTNDGWFWGSSELEMHLACGVFRAVECRKPLLVAANTGISAWIDSNGRIRARGRKRHVDTLLAEVVADGRSSPYLRYGDWPAGLCLLAAAVAAMLGLWGAVASPRASIIGAQRNTPPLDKTP
jgi:apolipoprotein N-acyltransferase